LEHRCSHGIGYVGVIPSSQRKPYLLLNSLQNKDKKRKDFTFSQCCLFPSGDTKLNLSKVRVLDYQCNGISDK